MARLHFLPTISGSRQQPPCRCPVTDADDEIHAPVRREKPRRENPRVPKLQHPTPRRAPQCRPSEHWPKRVGKISIPAYVDAFVSFYDGSRKWYQKTPAIRSFRYSYDAPATPSALTPSIKARERPKTTFPRRSVGTIKIIAVFRAFGAGRGKLSRAISSAGSGPRTGPAWLRQRRSQHCCSSSGALLRRGFWLQWPWLRRGLWREPPCRQAG